MRSPSLLLGAAAAGLLLAPVMATAQPAAQDRTAMHRDALHGLFTPEQRAMLMHRARKEFREQTRDERHAFRHQQVARLLAMTDTQRAQLKADLQAEWEALPPDRKDRIHQRIAMREQHRHDRMERGGTFQR